MFRSIGVSLVALALLAPAPSSAGQKRHMPGQILQARYVCLGYDLGSGFMSEQASIAAPYDVYPEDRRILESIHEEIDKWGKYVITLRPEQAELLVAVRAGRLAGASTGIGIGTGGRSGFGMNGGGGSVEFSSPHDTFTIYDSRGGQAGAQLWRVQKKGALAGSPPRAFEEWKAEVERAPVPEAKPDEKKPEEGKPVAPDPK